MSNYISLCNIPCIFEEKNWKFYIYKIKILIVISILFDFTNIIMAEKIKGQVKWFSESKGFGFITPDSGGNDIFVHFSGIQGDRYKTLSEGQKVEFEIQNGLKGPSAVNVVTI